MMIRGLRGATTVEANSADAIWAATQELLESLIEANGIVEDDVASIMFTTTPDLNAVYPAKAARLMGWSRTALMGFAEADVPDGLRMCIRVLIHWNTNKNLDEIQHVFLRGAEVLRPDLSNKEMIERDN
jgi:chorismate mutase